MTWALLFFRYMLNTDMNLLWDAEFRSIAQEFAEQPQGPAAFYHEFASAWAKVMNADMFVTAAPSAPTSTPGTDDASQWTDPQVMGVIYVCAT